MARAEKVSAATWPTAADPESMLRLLRGKVSDRKLRLFVCAVGRRVWPVLSDEQRAALAVAERLADGLCGEAERLAAFEAAGGDWSALYTQADGIPAKALLVENLEYYAADAATSATRVADDRRQYIRDAAPSEVAAEAAGQAGLIRCVIGNPFRSVAVDPSWRTTAAAALAGGIYADRAWDRMPILADALEDAGCTDPDVLGHLRGPGPHARGCWVVDRLLGMS